MWYIQRQDNALRDFILENLNNQRSEEALRTPWSQYEMEGTFSTEYSRLDLHHHKLIDELDEVLASLNVSLILLFHTTHKRQTKLVNLSEYKRKRLALNEYDSVLVLIDHVISLKDQAMDKWLKYAKDNEEHVYAERQGKFKF